MKRNDIPIWRDANRLLLLVEQAVRHFPRYHKYTLGSELRRQAMKICQWIHRAWQNRAQALAILPRLVLAVDDLKIQLQLAKELQVFRNFAEFEQLAELTVQVGKQSGGWLRRLQVAQPEVSRPA
ncbi:MAG: four helix bundle protein [Methylococcales bacterium]|nr:four helix bundle protein [Methylococcales bacterium]